MSLENSKNVLKNISSNIIKNCRFITNPYIIRLNDIARIIEAENKFAILCSYTHMDELRPIARGIASSGIRPFTEEYIDLLSDATKEIEAGKDPAELIDEYEFAWKRRCNQI